MLKLSNYYLSIIFINISITLYCCIIVHGDTFYEVKLIELSNYADVQEILIINTSNTTEIENACYQFQVEYLKTFDSIIHDTNEVFFNKFIKLLELSSSKNMCNELIDFYVNINKYLSTNNFLYIKNIYKNKYSYEIINNIIRNVNCGDILYRTYDKIEFILHIYKLGLYNIINKGEMTITGEAAKAMRLYIENCISEVEFQKKYYENFKINIDNFKLYDGKIIKNIPTNKEINFEIKRINDYISNENNIVLNVILKLHNDNILKKYIIEYFTGRRLIIVDNLEIRIIQCLGIREYLDILKREMFHNTNIFKIPRN